MRKAQKEATKKAFHVLLKAIGVIATYFLLVVFVYYNAPWRANAWIVTAAIYVPIVIIVYLLPFVIQRNKK